MGYDGHCFDCDGECKNKASKAEWSEALKLYKLERDKYMRSVKNNMPWFSHFPYYKMLKCKIEAKIVNKFDNIDSLISHLNQADIVDVVESKEGLNHE